MLDALLDLVLPRSCAGCATTGVGLCPACRALLAGPAVGLVRPDPCPPGLPLLSAFVRYEGAAQRLLLCHKERGHLQLARPLGTALATAVLVHAPASVVLCPVPSSPAASARGQDHAWRLATAAACPRCGARASPAHRRPTPRPRPGRGRPVGAVHPPAGSQPERCIAGCRPAGDTGRRRRRRRDDRCDARRGRPGAGGCGTLGGWRGRCGRHVQATDITQSGVTPSPGTRHRG